MVARGWIALPLAALAACASTPDPLRPLEPGETGCVVRAGKVFTMDDDDRVLAPGMVAVRNGRIVAVGERLDVPEGFERLEYPQGWIVPGFVDLHTHIHPGGGFGDLNDSVMPINAELRASPTVVPGNKEIRRAVAAGVTTLYGIPGSGSSIGGFGVLYKARWDSSYERTVFADPGGMKVAQDSNPQRGGGDMGASRAGLGWVLEDTNNKARAAASEERFALEYENLKRVHSGDLPVLIHTAGSEGVLNTSRMWRGTYPVRSVLSHGCFDAWKSSAAVSRAGMPVNNGPRMIDFGPSREGRVVGICAEYLASGARNLSLNTDSPVVPEEELFLQGAMAARYGADTYTMLRALTIHPAKAFGIDGRLGSLEPGKDADFSVFTGDPLDPRSRVEVVLIEGSIEYDSALGGPRPAAQSR